MLAAINTATGKLIDARSATTDRRTGQPTPAAEENLRAWAAARGVSAGDVEIREVTDAELQTLIAAKAPPPEPSRLEKLEAAAIAKGLLTEKDIDDAVVVRGARN